jgi:rare lipoprotein A (peptidoglycan hydrolase)
MMSYNNANSREIFCAQNGPERSVKIGGRPHAVRMLLGPLFLVTALWAGVAFADVGTASYYTRASCIAESGQCTMANGRDLKDEDFTCASWMYRFGTVLVVTRMPDGKDKNGLPYYVDRRGRRSSAVGLRTVKVKVTDRGPARRLVARGRIIDLSHAAFAALADVSQGIIKVNVRRAI